MAAIWTWLKTTALALWELEKSSMIVRLITAVAVGFILGRIL